MSNPEHLERINREGVEAWNRWRRQNPEISPDLSGAAFIGVNFTRANFSGAILSDARFDGAFFSGFPYFQLDTFYDGPLKINYIVMDFSDADFRGVNFSGANFCGACFNLANFSNANLRAAGFSGAHFSVCIPSVPFNVADFSGSDFNGADFSNVDTNFEGVQFNEVNLPKANLTRVNLKFAKLRGANLSEADLSGANLVETDLTEANLDNALLKEITSKFANLSKASVKNANLSKAMLRHANLAKTDLTGTDCTEVDFTLADLFDTNFSRANLSRATFWHAEFNNAEDDKERKAISTSTAPRDVTYKKIGKTLANKALNILTSFLTLMMRNPPWNEEYEFQKFRNVDLNSVDRRLAALKEHDFSGVKLIKANCSYANFGSIRLHGADFSKSNCTKANFSHAELRAVNFADADLTAADFTRANLGIADFSRANLSHAVILFANLTGANLTDAIVLGVRYLASPIYPQYMMRGNYMGIRGLSSCYGNRVFVRDASDQDYLDTLKSQLHSPWGRFCFWLWGLTNYGRSFMSVIGLALMLVCSFGKVYSHWPQTISAGDRCPTAFTPYYFSIVTYTTLGFGDVKPNNLEGEILVSTEVILGYITLGLLLAVLGDKIARRAS